MVREIPRGRAAKYCSVACRQKAYRIRKKLGPVEDSMRDRKEAAIRVLKELGYRVRLDRERTPCKPVLVK